MFVRQARENESTWLYKTIKQNNKETEILDVDDALFVCSERENKPLGLVQQIQYSGMNNNWIELTNLLCLQQTRHSVISSQLFNYILTNIESTEKTTKILIFTHEPEKYERYGFTVSSNTALPQKLIERFNQKISTLEEALHPIIVNITELEIPRTNAHNVKDIQTEKESLGFADEDELTYKYSVE